jgi:hypothetical protein
MQHGSTLYNLGVSYYAYGTIKTGRKVYGYFYKLSKPATVEQIEAIRKEYPYVETHRSQSQYAPELTASVLMFPSKAQLKRQGV